MSTLPIIDILRKAHAGSRRLDVRIYLALTGGRMVGANCLWERVIERIHVPLYSTTIEGSMLTLPLGDYDWDFSICGSGCSAIAKARRGLSASGWKSASTAALAGCLAGFTLLAQQEAQRRAA